MPFSEIQLGSEIDSGLIIRGSASSLSNPVDATFSRERESAPRGSREFRDSEEARGERVNIGLCDWMTREERADLSGMKESYIKRGRLVEFGKLHG